MTLAFPQLWYCKGGLEADSRALSTRCDPLPYLTHPHTPPPPLGRVARIPGVAECLAASPPHDPVAKALRDSAIRAQGGDGMTLRAVQRFELLHAATELLPPGARAAHEGEMLSRHHTESFDAETLKQVRRVQRSHA